MGRRDNSLLRELARRLRSYVPTQSSTLAGRSASVVLRSSSFSLPRGCTSSSVSATLGLWFHAEEWLDIVTALQAASIPPNLDTGRALRRRCGHAVAFLNERYRDEGLTFFMEAHTVWGHGSEVRVTIVKRCEELKSGGVTGPIAWARELHSVGETEAACYAPLLAEIVQGAHNADSAALAPTALIVATVLPPS